MPSYPRYRGAGTADVVIIGGGLTGCATAYALSAAGVKVVLLEADQIGRGTTAASAGWMGDEPGVGFAELEKALGLRDARRGLAGVASRRPRLRGAASPSEHQVRAGAARLDDGGTEPRAGAAAQTRAESAPRRRHRRAAARTRGRISGELGFAALAGIRARDGATIDPYRAAVGLARAAVERGARLFERSPVTRITFGRRDAEVHTAGGRIRTDAGGRGDRRARRPSSRGFAATSGFGRAIPR